MDVVNGITEVISINEICRLCTNRNDKLIGIYSEDGINNELAIKMNMYLPVKVNETDDLPLQCCWQCASTVLAWHELVVTSIEADRRLKNYQLSTEKQNNLIVKDTNFEAIVLKSNEEEDLNTFCQSDTIQENEDGESSASAAVGFIIPGDNEHLEDYVNLEPQYLTVSQGEYEIKIEKPIKDEKNDEKLSTKEVTLKNHDLESDQKNKEKLYTCQTCNIIIDEGQIASHILEVHKTDDVKLQLPLPQKEKKRKSNEKGRNNKINYELLDAAKVAVENLEEYINLGPQYLTVNQGGYEIKIEKPIKDEKNDEKLYMKELTPKIQDLEDDQKDLKEKLYTCQTCNIIVDEGQFPSHILEAHKTDDVKLQLPLPHKEKNGKSKEKHRNNKINYELVDAAKVVVDGKVYYNCKACGRVLHSPYTFIWHMRIHTGERPHTCDLCGKHFRVSQGLIRHLKETHQRIKNFACDICSRKFATKRNVEEHRRIHTNERPYVCDLCGKTFKQKASLFVHNRSHSDFFPFKCSFCNQMFRTRPPLLIHITKHTGEKPYPCDICGRHFRIKYELKRHLLIHSDEKPFSCNLCGLSFKQKRYLRNHIKLNHNIINNIT